MVRSGALLIVWLCSALLLSGCAKHGTRPRIVGETVTVREKARDSSRTMPPRRRTVTRHNGGAVQSPRNDGPRAVGTTGRDGQNGATVSDVDGASTTTAADPPSSVPPAGSIGRNSDLNIEERRPLSSVSIAAGVIIALAVAMAVAAWILRRRRTPART